MNAFFESVTTIALMIATVGIISVVVSKKSQTPAVIQASGSAFSNALGVAESPVTGASTPLNLSYPGGALGGNLPDFSTSFGFG